VTKDRVGCRECFYYVSEGSEGQDYWWPSCGKPGNERLKNLRSFPFKTTRPCFESLAEVIEDESSEP
jgi:hypothetical protein